MRTKFTLRALPVFMGGMLFLLPCDGQVMIEGGSFGAQISNRDGMTSVRPSGGYPQRTVSGTSFSIQNDGGLNLNSPVRGVNAPTPRFTPPVVRVVQSENAVPQPIVREINIKQIQALRRMEKELGVIKTNQNLWIAFDVDTLFSGSSVSVKQSAKYLLDKILDYRARVNGRSISVTYEFNASDSEMRGVDRAGSIVDYMIQKSGANPGRFCICEPKRLQNTVVRNPYSSGPRPSGKSVVNFLIARR